MQDDILVEQTLEPLSNEPGNSKYTIVEGIYDALECADEIEDLFYNGREPGFTTGFSDLDQKYRVKRKQWTVITGVPSSGKSTFLNTLLMNLSEMHGWKHLIVSPENIPIADHIAELTAIKARKSFHPDYMSEEAYFAALEFIQEHFQFMLPPEEDFTVTHILDMAKFTEQEGFKFDGLLIDPWNELEHKHPVAQSETQYVSWALSRFRRYCKDYDKHLWLVAHPTKMRKIEKKNLTLEETERPVFPVATLYDINGSANFYNKTDMGLSIWRDKYSDDNLMDIHVQKVRFRHTGEVGKATLRFDWHTGRVENL